MTFHESAEEVFTEGLLGAPTFAHRRELRLDSRMFVSTPNPVVSQESPTPMVVVADGPYFLTLDDEKVNARSLAYAKALAPQMFQRLGTKVMFKTITIADKEGTVVGKYNRFGWHDPLPQSVSASLDTLLLNDCLGCDGYAPAGEVFCTPQCQQEAAARGEVLEQADGYSDKQAA